MLRKTIRNAAAISLLLTPLALSAHEGTAGQLQALNAALEADASNPALHLRRGEAYRLNGQWEPALDDYAAAETLGGPAAAIDLARARLELDRDRPADALDCVTEAQKEDSFRFDALLLRASALTALRRQTEAVAAYDEALAIALQPTPDLYHQRAQLIAASGDAAEAVRSLDDATERLGFVASLQIEALELEERSGQLAAALQRVDSLAGRFTRNESWLMRRGGLLERAARREEARAAYADALARIDALPDVQRGTRTTLELRRECVAALLRLSSDDHDSTRARR